MSQKILKNIKPNVQCLAKIKQQNLHVSWMMPRFTPSRGTATVTVVGVLKIKSQLVKFPLYGLKVQ